MNVPRPCSRAAVALAALLLGAPYAAAQVAVPLTVNGNEATGVIALPGGIGADLTIRFEEVVGLHPGALEVSARLISPLDGGFLSRLAPGVSLPVAFPMALSIEPSPESALSFSGVVSVSLHTHNLHLVPQVPLALHSAHGGGPFRDITATEGVGSYRAGGTGGGFSEFAIVVDVRPIDSIITAKFDALQALLEAHGGSMPPSVLDVLQDRLTQARAQHSTGQTLAAIGSMTAFGQFVRAHSGADIPDVWRAHDPRPNVAGYLRGGADTVKFSLARKSSQ